MFMRGVLSEEAKVGLMLFDEPSAALDPTSEHGGPILPVIQSFIGNNQEIHQTCLHGFGNSRERKR